MDSLVYALPIIHFSDDKPGIKSNRTIRGTARMIGDGVVRWSLVCNYPRSLFLSYMYFLFGF